MKPVPVRLEKSIILELDELVREGKYMNRSDAIRMAIRDFYKTYFQKPEQEFFTLEEEEKEKEKEELDVKNYQTKK